MPELAPLAPPAAETPLDARTIARDFVDRTTERETFVQAVAAILSHREFLKNLVFRDLKLKYRGSVLGFVWSLVNPLAMVAIYTLAFKYIFGNKQPGFPFFILLGTLAWSFFANAATMATTAIIDSGGLVRTVRFPRAILPIATVLFNLAQYVLTVLVLVPVMLIVLGRPLTSSMLFFPAILLLQTAFTIGVALLLAAATTYFRDVRHFVEVALPLLFWTTPIVYSIDIVNDTPSLQSAILASPMTPFILGYQRAFYEGVWPDQTLWLHAIVYGLGMLAVGIKVFLSLERDLTERL